MAKRRAVRISVTVDSTGAITGIQAVGTAAATTAAKSRKEIGTLGDQVRDLGKQALVAAAAFAGFAAIKGLMTSTFQAVAEGEKVMAQLQAGVRSTGGAAGFSAEQLAEMAERLSRVTALDDEVIAGGEALLLTFNRIKGAQFFDAMTDAMDLAARKGIDLDAAVQAIGKAYSGSVGTLKKAGVVLTSEQEKHLKNLFDTGRAMEAQVELHKLLQVAVGGSAAAYRDTMGGAVDALKVRWENLLQEVGGSGSGAFRTGIEGMIALLEWLTDNFSTMEAAVLETFADLVTAAAVWADLTAGSVEKVGRMFVWLSDLSPFSRDKDVASARRLLDGIADMRQGLRDAAEGLRMKAAEALEGIDRGARVAAPALRMVGDEVEDVSEKLGSAKVAARNMFRELAAPTQLRLLPEWGAAPDASRLAPLDAEAEILERINGERERAAAMMGAAISMHERGLISEAERNALMREYADTWEALPGQISAAAVLMEDMMASLASAGRGVAQDLARGLVDAARGGSVEMGDILIDHTARLVEDWLSMWIEAMGKWLVKWTATQAAAKTASASMGGGGAGAGSFSGLFQMAGLAKGGGAAGGGASTSAMAGYAVAAYALFVFYKAAIEDHKQKFARIQITDGQAQVIAAHGRKYIKGLQTAAAQIVDDLQGFMKSINVTMDRLGTVVMNSSKSGFYVSQSQTQGGKAFKDIEAAKQYAQVLMLKYGEFSESVSALVQAVIRGTKAINLAQLADDIAFARELETQNMPDAGKQMADALALATEQWGRAQELLLGMFNEDLPAFAAAAESIVMRLAGSSRDVYNQLAGIEVDPAAEWEAKRQAYNLQRTLVLLQLQQWKREIDGRIANYNSMVQYGSGVNNLTRNWLNQARYMADAAGATDESLQGLLNAQALLDEAIRNMPPELKPGDYKPPKGGKGGGSGATREDLLRELRQLRADAAGGLAGMFMDLQERIAEWRRKVKESGGSAAELAEGIRLMTAAMREEIRTRAEGLAGRGTDFTRELLEGLKFFQDALDPANWKREEGRGGVAARPPIDPALREEFLARMGRELEGAIAAFAGLENPMLAIQARAEELRSGVRAYGEAMGWTAEQIDAALAQIEGGVEMQRQQGIAGLMGRMFKDLEGTGKFAAEALEAKRQEVILSYDLIKAQLEFYGAWDDKTRAIWEAARGAAIVAAGQAEGAWTRAGRAAADAAPDRDWQAEVANIRQAWRRGIQGLIQDTKELLTDDELSSLTQAEQLAAAQAHYSEILARANAGDVEALGQLAAARRELLSELRESEAGGTDYRVAFEQILAETAALLSNAAEIEQTAVETFYAQLQAEVAAGTAATTQGAEFISDSIYASAAQVAAAIYGAINGVPHLAGGGVVTAPTLAMLGERRRPEAVLPLSYLGAHWGRPASLGPMHGSPGASKTDLRRVEHATESTARRLASVESLMERSVKAAQDAAAAAGRSATAASTAVQQARRRA